MNGHINAISRLILGFNLLVFLSTAGAQNSNGIKNSIPTYPQVEIAGSEVREFQSDITGERYFIQVALPRSYRDSPESYPVLYIMDADGSFGTCTEITRLLALGEEVPEMIIVGIAYQASLEEYLFNRRRDYTPTAVDRYPGSGISVYRSRGIVPSPVKEIFFEGCLIGDSDYYHFRYFFTKSQQPGNFRTGTKRTIGIHYVQYRIRLW